MAVLARSISVAVSAGPTAHALRFADSFELKLRAYAKAGDKVSIALLDPAATHTDFADCIALREDLTLSYLPRGKDGEAEAGAWKPKNRQNGRPGKVARSLLLAHYIANYLTDADFEAFTNKVRGETVEVAGNADEEVSAYGLVKLVRGEEIRRWYNGANALSGAVGSCMSHAHCQPWFNIYVENANVGLLVVIKDNRLVGRALVWNTIKGDTVLDRIYANTGPSEVLRAYAKKRGWLTDVWGSSNYHVVQLEKTVFKSYPYIDSFRYVDHKRKTLTNNKGADHYDQSLGYADGGPHVNLSCWSCKSVFTDENELALNDQGAFCKACMKKHRCVRCEKFDVKQTSGLCQDCVAFRTCAYCAQVDAERDLRDDACTACHKLGRDGRDQVRADRLEAIRLREERRARRVELRATRDRNRAAFERRIGQGPQNLQNAWALCYVPTQEAFLEHDATAFAAYSDKELRQLMEEIDKQFRVAYVANFAAIESGVIRSTDLIGPELEQRLRNNDLDRRANIVP